MADVKMCLNADEKLGSFIAGFDREISHHRMPQQATKCGFGLAGVCCKLCSNGPCRITPKSPKGVCGADADTIVMRNFLRSVAAGSGCYTHVVENAAKNLKKMALDGVAFKGKDTLDRLAAKLEVEGTDQEKALAIAELVLDDVRKPFEEKMVVLEKMGYDKRIAKWKALGIMPGGAKDEILNALVKTSTNLNSDPVDMLLQCLRLGISTGMYGLMLTNLLQDIMMGEAQIGFNKVGLGVADPEYVNIMCIGHQHNLFMGLQNELAKPEVQEAAVQAGAKGIKIVGCTCVGQDLQVRNAACPECFAGHAGNNYASEAVLMTGCIDLVVTEFNCALPGIESICADLNIPQVCIDDVAKKANAELKPFNYDTMEADSAAIVAQAIASFQTKDAGRINPMADHGYDNAITGVTEETLKGFLGGSFAPLLELIANGTIRGVAAVVGCSNLRGGGHDVFTVDLTKELIKRNIIVLSAGCSSGALENVGLMSPEAADLAGDSLKEVCKSLGIPPVLNFGPCLAIGRIEMVAAELAAALGVDIPDLPVAVSAPQWLEEQALADGSFALALGLPVHLGLTPFVTGSPIALEVLTNQMKDLTGGFLFCNEDMVASAEQIAEIIEEKRAKLGI